MNEDRMTPKTRAMLAEAAERKTFVMESSVAQLRAIVIGVNIFAWFVFLGVDSPRAPLALAIIVIAATYGAWSLLTRPYERYPLLRFGALTLTTDVGLITLWVLATGGAQSEFWVIYFVSVVSVAMRYDLPKTMLTAFGEAAVYGIAMAADGGLPGIAALIRPAYILIAGGAAGLLARQEGLAREERVVLQELAHENSRLLDRERETVERLRQLDRLKTEFVANAAHELRTPLTSLAGFAQTLSTRHDELRPEQLREALSAMGRQGDRARILIQNLLDLSQLDGDAMPMHVERVPLATAVKSALELVPPPDGGRVEVAVGDGVRVSADPVRLEQVLVNLLSNAFRYGGSTTRIEAAERRGVVRLVVADDGEGVPEELVPHLFEPFARGRHVRGTPGSGLGLAITRRLVEAFGGTVEYEPGPDGGARFVTELPAA